MNSIFSEESAESGHIFHAACVAHQLLKIREVFAETIECEALFKKPSVRDEMGILCEVSKPNAVNEIEIYAEFKFNQLWLYARRSIVFLESFSESV